MGVDGIKEFKVITSNFTAEYGMAMGSQMAMVSANGTNQSPVTCLIFCGTARSTLATTSTCRLPG